MIVLTCVYMYIDALRFVICFSQFEEKFEEINGDEASPSIPLTSGLDGNSAAPMVTEESRNDTEIQGQEDHRQCFDINASQDFVSGIMKIVPEVDSDADYWLLPDGDVSITDMWTEHILYS
ncbi:transcription factor E2FB-like [Camellia sinensis]|uniref:transcription factor E2FB-like n=1 Tax=Camellia sinensis TaxID=4442 RepID=UPI001035808C|nr:transcription factor E2FB-like [Camellia sinensis]